MKNAQFMTLMIFSALLSFTSHAASKNILAIFAHADDEIIMSATINKFVREGHKVTLVYATDGSWGVTEHSNIPAGQKLALARVKEMQCAAQRIHAEQPLFLKFEDGTLSNNQVHQPLHDKIVTLMIKLKPDIVFTWGPDGGYGHPDHRMISNITTEVFQKVADPTIQSLFYPGLPMQSEASLPRVDTAIGQFFRNNFHRLNPQFLPLKKTYEQIDFDAAYQSYLCHETQYTKHQIDDIFIIRKTLNNVDYFRPWSNQLSPHLSIFD